jgi:cobaltochelatase CobN
MSKKKIIILSIIAVAVIGIAVTIWNAWFSTTRIAFVNYQAITLGQIAKANDNSFIKIKELSVEDLEKAGKYDMIFVNGMGLRITEEQRQHLQDAADKGTPVLTTATTNPQNYIVSVDSIDAEFMKQYLNGANRSNYRSLLNYVRKFIDGKKAFIDEPKDPSASTRSLLYHCNPAKPEEEDMAFDSLREYELFLKKHNLYNETAPKIILTGQMGVPDSLIYKLEQSGNVVYPVNSLQNFIKHGHADSLHVAAIINMAHGRLGDDVVDYLKAKNIPLFSTVNVNRTYEEWMDDNQGMSGGFMSQSIVTPEIDGAIRPFALFAHYTGKDGLPYVAAIPDRLNEYVETVNRYVGLQTKKNSDKKVAIFYFKGPGQNALVAEGMDVARSLYNTLTRLKAEGYNVANLPASAEALENLINERGRVFGSYAVGAQQEFIKKCSPVLVGKADYDKWASAAMPKEMSKEIEAVDGVFPGKGLHTESGEVAIASLQFGNVVLIPQTAAGYGDDDFKVVHGTDVAPPHSYVAAYLWARYGFKADALIHFGAHGSLEFTPRKQVALSSRDWSDRLVGTMPHFYIYSTSNVGEAMTAKRRSYAGIINYLTPPFIESNVRGIYSELSNAILTYNKLVGQEASEATLKKASLEVKKLTVKLGIHRELRMDSTLSKPYSEDEIARIESFAEELANEKITGQLYVMGVPYDNAHVQSTVLAMTVDPIAYSLYALDLKSGKATADLMKHKALFTQRYATPARALVQRIINLNGTPSDAEICSTLGISTAQLAEARSIDSTLNESKDLYSKMMVMASSMTGGQKPTAKLADRKKSSAKKGMPHIPGMSPEKALAMARSMGADEASLKKMEAAMKSGKKSGKPGAPSGMSAMMGGGEEISKEKREYATAIMEAVRAIYNVNNYKNALLQSPENELASLLNGLNGGYIAPTSGGDPILNPNVLPTGRNMFAVNAEETPSAAAWEKGKELAENTIDMYRKNHHDSIPKKVSYTLWSSEFIETEGATIAQILYMLGVEPIRDPFGRVTDIRLIPSKELGRPRIDVVVQTSGQLRDLAASRLFLINRAVEMAAAAKDKEYANFVADGVVDSEKHLVNKGVSPKEARELSTARVFGGVNGNYGSGIQEMVEAGDRWENESEIAETYINNMGAFYGSEENWEQMREYAFEAALTNTEVVVQPRQSNTWGALSLDHVYEFMGGMNLAVRNVTGKDPEAYLSDYRNRNNAKMQEVKEAIGVESRTTILNPTYIQEKMKGGAGDASQIADVVRNTYGWNVMKPAAIDNELWNDIYETYVEDKNNLGTKEYFTQNNPAALEEMTAVMMETIRKGMWKASKEQIAKIAELHTEIVNKYQPSCSGFVCDNAKLKEFISENVSKETAAEYNSNIGKIRDEVAEGGDGTRMKKEELNKIESEKSYVNGVLVAVAVAIVIVILLAVMRRRRKKMEE